MHSDNGIYAIGSNTILFMGGGGGESFKTIGGGQEENVSDKENSPGPPVTLKMKGPLFES